MKQNITPDQLNELSDNAARKLHKWANNVESIGLGGNMLLSIGQMIEFLDENNDIWGIKQKENGAWKLEAPLFDFNNKELCDALWSGVKEVLEK